MEAFEETAGSPLHRAMQSVKDRPGDESALYAELTRIAEDYSSMARWEAGLEPHFRRRWQREHKQRKAEGPRPLRIAVIVSGQSRTMLEPDIVEGYRRIVSSLASLRALEKNCRGANLEDGQDSALVNNNNNTVRVFAYLELTPGRTYQRSGDPHVPFHKRPKQPPAWNPGYITDRKSVEAAISRWSPTGGFELQLFDPSRSAESMASPQQSVYPNAALDCDGTVLRSLKDEGRSPSQMMQFLKVAAAVNMMRRDEAQSGQRFDVLVRLRPDLCAGSVDRFVSLATAYAAAVEARVPFLVYDAAAVVPRWAAGVLGSAWRTFGPQCIPDSRWANPCNPLAVNVAEAAQPAVPTAGAVEGAQSLQCMGGALETHFAALGAWALDLHYFWAPFPDMRNTSNLSPNEPALRRDRGCAAFC